MTQGLDRAEPIRTSLDECDHVLEESELHAIEAGEIPASLVKRARQVAGHELRLWRITSRGMLLVKTIAADGVAELAGGRP